MQILRGYKNILILIWFIIVRSILAFLVFLVTHILGKKILLDREINSPFECGFSTKEESRFPFSLRFFLVALIFLIFDVELLILFPYLRSIIFSNRLFRIIIYFLFLSILSTGLFYEWNNLILEWIK